MQVRNRRIERIRGRLGRELRIARPACVRAVPVKVTAVPMRRWHVAAGACALRQGTRRIRGPVRIRLLRRMRPGLCYNVRMQLYRFLGYWHFEVQAASEVGVNDSNPVWPGPDPSVPYLMDETIFRSYVRYVIRVAYYSFGQRWDELVMWSAWAQASINWIAQHQSIYKWQPLDADAAQGYFEHALVRELSGPTFSREALVEEDFLSCLAVYGEEVWLYKQGGTAANPENVFTEIGPLGSILMWTSRAGNWLKGHPDRMVFAMRRYDLIQNVPFIIGRYWTKGAAMFLGKGVKIDAGKYKVGGGLGYHVDRVPPNDTWKMW